MGRLYPFGGNGSLFAGNGSLFGGNGSLFGGNGSLFRFVCLKEMSPKIQFRTFPRAASSKIWLILGGQGDNLKKHNDTEVVQSP